jgi:hypothetical protein
MIEVGTYSFGAIPSINCLVGEPLIGNVSTLLVLGGVHLVLCVGFFQGFDVISR